MLKLMAVDGRMTREQLDQILADPSTAHSWAEPAEVPSQISYRVFADGSIAYLIRWTRHGGDITKQTGNWRTGCWDATHDHWPVYHAMWFRWLEWHHRDWYGDK